MPKPRLLLVLTEFPPSFGGMQTHAIYLCRHLEERGYPIAVATYRQEGSEAVDRELDFPVHRTLSRIGYWHNISQLERLAASFGPDLAYSSTIFYGHFSQRTGVPMICRSAGNDVLRPWISWPYRPLSETFSAPWFEDFAYDRFRRFDWPEYLEGLLLNRRRRVMVESATRMSRVLANSEFTGRLLDSIGVDHSKMKILPGGVEAARFNPGTCDRVDLRRKLGIPPSGYVLFTACRLVEKKGIDLLIGAMPALLQRMPDAHLLIAGEGRDRAKCERLAAGLGVSHAIQFAGYVEHETLHQYYWAADQFVLASRETVHGPARLRDVETMGRVLCEANAAGIPVVASRSGGIPSIIQEGENGLLFEEGCAGEMLDRIVQVRENRALAERLRESGLRRAESVFDWRVICDAHEREFATGGHARRNVVEPAFAASPL